MAWQWKRVLKISAWVAVLIIAVVYLQRFGIGPLKEAVDDMAEAIPIRDMLTVATVERAVPQFHPAAGADGWPVHQEQQSTRHCRYQGRQQKTASVPSLMRCRQCADPPPLAKMRLSGH